VRAAVEPVPQRADVAGQQRVQDQRREREVVHPLDRGGQLDRIPVRGVHLGEDAEPEPVRLGGEIGDERVGLRGEEARRARCLHRIADRVEADHGHPALGEPLQDRGQVAAGGGIVDVEVDLPAGERRPHQPRLPAQQHRSERQSRARPEDPGQVGLGRTGREHPAEGEEHAGVGRLLAPSDNVPELGRRGAHVVDDEVDHRVPAPAERRDVSPGAEPAVDP
jgi:hypothetical protein